MDIVKYEEGKSCKEIAFVFACPGRVEADADNGKGRVCAGKTGDNLEKLIRKLNEKEPELFQIPNGNNEDRYEYLITNSYDGVLYKDKDRRTQPYIREIKNEENIKRLSRELKGCKIIIAMGKKAEVAIKELEKQKLLNEKRIAFSRHLGLQSLNPWKKGRTLDEKIEFLAKQIFEDIKKQ